MSNSRAFYYGNEAKVAELANGHLMMSVRTFGKRRFTLSKDFGVTWSTSFLQTDIIEPSCNGDFIRYTLMDEGFDKDRLLHSIPYATTRNNVSVLMSSDEGETWPVRKTIYPGVSAYSSLTILKDGSIGMYYEVGEYDIYQMYFARFSVNWLTDGADSWSQTIDSDDFVQLKSSYYVYPNPADDFLIISGTFSPDARIEIYNLHGVLMESLSVDGQREVVQIAVHGYSPGLYYLRIGDETLKFIVK